MRGKIERKYNLPVTLSHISANGNLEIGALQSALIYFNRRHVAKIEIYE
jgi:hypothetical protein